MTVAQTVLAVALATAVGCSSTGRSTSTKTSSSVATLQQRIVTGEQNINAAIASLDDLVNKPQPDLRPQYKAFLNALAKLEDQIKKGKGEREAMKAQTEAYFAKWEEESRSLENQQIKEAMAARRDAIKAMFAKIRTEFEAGKPSFELFMRDLREIKKALDFDLTVGGLNAIKPIVAKAQKESADVIKRLTVIRGELDKVAVEMAASAPAQK
jgi:hypothetical protein